MSAEGTLQVLQPSVGYGLVAGLGAAFCIIMILITMIQNRYASYNTFESTEEFNTASRSVKPGMIAAGIVSSWTHATTLLTSCTLAFSYGVSGGLWFGAVGSCQTLLFAVTAYRVKKGANNAHTFPEIVLARHGRFAHHIFTFLGLLSNVINGSALLTGGCSVFSELSGMNIWASYFILILAVQSYIVVGGLRSTFICDYLHTTFLYGCIFTFMFCVYVADPAIGSPGRLYDLLAQQARDPETAADSFNGSYMTVRSQDGLIHAMTILIGSFSAIWTDQAYWQRVIASDPRTAVRAYVLGSAAWYAIPFAMATCMGLAAAALQDSPVFPVILTEQQVSDGMAAPAAAIALLGRHGAALIIVLLFMAVTSSTSAESIAASSLITFDIYKAYWNKNASSKALLWVSIAGLLIYGLVLAAVCCIFHAVGISLGFLVKIFGCLMGGGSFPMAAIVLWDRTSTVAAQVSPILALCSGLVTWLVCAHVRSGSISVDTLGDSYNSLAGDCVALGVGLVAVVALSYAFPGKSPTPITTQGEEDPATEAVVATELKTPEGLVDEKKKSARTTTNDDLEEGGTANVEGHFTRGASTSEPIVPVSALTDAQVRSQRIFAFSALAVGVLGFLVLLPFTLYGTAYVFSRGFFTFYVVVAFIWIFISGIICVVMPVWESRAVLVRVAAALVRDTRTKAAGVRGNGS